MKIQRTPTASFDAAPQVLAAQSAPPSWLVLLLAAACGLIVANIYYAQPLIALIAPDIGLSPADSSLIVTLTQLGYCLGMLLLVPLGDLVENRRLIVVTLAGVICSLALSAATHSSKLFLLASLAVGLGSVAVQMLVPVAAHLAPQAIRGRIVGNVMSGLLTGIMLARPVSSLIAGSFGWRAVFIFSAALMILMALTLRRLLPERRPNADHHYGELLVSLWFLLRDTPALRRRAAYQAALFGAFTLFWTAVPLLLAGPRFQMTQHGIAMFALVGVSGAISAPFAGRLADRGKTRVATGAAIVMAAASFLLARMGNSGSLAALVAACILLDLAVQANQVLSQRVIFALAAHVRSRVNGLYMALNFVGGALGSLLASQIYERGGWDMVSWIGFAFPVVALLLYTTEWRKKQA